MQIVDALANERPTVTLHDLTVLDDDGPGRALESFGVPAQIGRFHVLGVLGSGGMGVVLEAHDEALERRVALKVMRARVSGGNDRRHSLWREGRALAGLSHPNVVQVFEVGEHDGQVYIAMEQVVGPNLEEWLEQEPRSFAQIRDMLCAAGRGLQAAHSRGLLHRDFKPENVLVGEDGRPRVVDFGLVSRLPDSEELTNTPVSLGPVTMGGKQAGTVPFMAPEQLMGWPLDHRADQFAFCISLYEAVYGRHPFDAPGMMEIGLRIIAGEMDPPPPRPDVPRWLPRVIARGLSPKPEDRFPNMAALLDALDPPKRPRVTPRRVWSSLLVVLMVLGVSSSAMAPAPSDRCADARSLLGQAWGPQRRATTEQVVRHGDVADPDETWPRIRDRLDGYAADWRRADRQVCEAARGPSDEERWFSQTRCLDARLRDLKRLVDAIDESGDGVIAQAVAAIGNLGEIDECLDPESASAREGLGVLGPQQEATAAELRALIAEARIESDLRRADRALTILEPVMARVERLGYPPLVAEAKYALGNALIAQGRLPPAEQALADAFWLAQGTHQAEMAVEAGYRLIHLTGDLQLRFDDGMSWARHTQALIDREDIGGAAKAWTLNNQGTVLLRHQRLDEAEQALEAALAVEGIEPNDEASFRLNLGSVKIMRGDRQQAAALYREAIRLREQHFGPSHSSLISSLVNLGTVELANGELDRAQSSLERALRLTERPGGESALRSKVLIVLAAVLQEQGRAQLAREHLMRAHDQLVAAGGSSHADLAMVLGVMADIDEGEGRLVEAKENFRRAHALLEARVGSQHPNVVALAESLSRVDLALGARGAQGEVDSADERRRR